MTDLKSEKQKNKIIENIMGRFMEIYVLFYLCIFPLCIHEKYYDILTFRFSLFWMPTLVYGCIFLLLGIIYLISDALHNKGININSLFQEFKPTATDIAFTVLILIFSISTACAEYPYEAFWGDRGRNQGLLLWLMFYIAYILITRFYKYKKWHLYAYMLFSSIVCIWGIFNYFMISFGMFDGTDPLNAYKFVSSIGNINTYNGYTAIFYGVAAVAFMLATKTYDNIFSFIMLLIVTFAHIMGKSDNAILSTAAVWLVIPLLFIKNWSQVSKFFTVILMFIASLKGIYMISSVGIPTMNDENPSTIIALGDKGIVTVLLVVVLLAAVATGYYGVKGRDMSDKVLKRLKKAWITLIAIGFITVITILILANKGVHPEIWEPYKNILIFNDEWGTFRGLNWRLAMEYWNNDASLFAKIFGYGPDTYYIITMDRFFDIMYWNDYGYFDSVHNEYLEYMLTVGIAGLIAYVAFLSTAVKEMLSSHKNEAGMVAVGVIAYAVQAVVNIAIAITTPVLMILMFVGIAAAGIKSKSNNE